MTGPIFDLDGLRPDQVHMVQNLVQGILDGRVTDDHLAALQTTIVSGGDWQAELDRLLAACRG